MKRRIMIITFIVILTQFFAFTTFGDEEIHTTNSTIILNGDVQQFSVPTITYKDRTMVPMRELFEKLNATVEWVETEQKIIAKSNTKTIEMQIDNSWAVCNDIDIFLDAPPILYNDRTMIPLRFVGEQLNLKVEWDGSANTIKLNSLGETTIGYAERVVQYDKASERQTYYGELINGVPNGVGVKGYYLNNEEEPYLTRSGNFIDWEENGFVGSDRRSGFYQDGKQNGFGWFEDFEGNYFEGVYENGKLTGKCYIKYANGRKYEGEVYSGSSYKVLGEVKINHFEGIPHGYGIITYEDGGRYEGYWQYDMRHGEGKIYWPNGNLAYEGVFENDGMNGWGKEYRENGTLIYEGGHWNGKRCSVGTSYFENGNIIYTGEWNENSFHGYGKLYYEDGSLFYEGNFKNGNFSGYGKMRLKYTNSNTIIYEGDVFDGWRHGLGKEYYSNGVLKYEGEFRNGGWDGYGKLYKPDGTLDYDGRFTYNEDTNESTWYRNR
ncbi:MAG: hypothetical protein BWY15_00979 [Firmicutes bacterium ADurb.Bin193]|nr:MAG: hypothetical protein BWY15_00979 [Firmicutes bacterium ADurb.Bin193]